MLSCACATLGIVLKLVSCWVRKETRLFVCLFRWWQFPPRTENCIHLSLSLSLVDSKCSWSAQSVGCMPSETLASHLSICWHPVLSVQSDSSFDPVWFLLRENSLDSFTKCKDHLSNCIGHIYNIVHVANRLDVLCIYLSFSFIHFFLPFSVSCCVCKI